MLPGSSCRRALGDLWKPFFNKKLTCFKYTFNPTLQLQIQLVCFRRSPRGTVRHKLMEGLPPLYVQMGTCMPTHVSRPIKEARHETTVE